MPFLEPASTLPFVWSGCLDQSMDGVAGEAKAPFLFYHCFAVVVRPSITSSSFNSSAICINWLAYDCLYNNHIVHWGDGHHHRWTHSRDQWDVLNATTTRIVLHLIALQNLKDVLWWLHSIDHSQWADRYSRMCTFIYGQVWAELKALQRPQPTVSDVEEGGLMENPFQAKHLFGIPDLRVEYHE